MASKSQDGRNAFLDGEHHWCDICETPFDELADLIRHDCDSPRVRSSRGGDDAE